VAINKSRPPFWLCGILDYHGPTAVCSVGVETGVLRVPAFSPAMAGTSDRVATFDIRLGGSTGQCNTFIYLIE
jgi:hypothetical protein